MQIVGINFVVATMVGMYARKHGRHGLLWFALAIAVLLVGEHALFTAVIVLLAP